MRVFVTGATGFIGSRVVPELIGAGHTVLGMTRSESGAEALRAQGAEAHFGTLEAPDTVAAGAAQCEGVIHCAFDHDFSNFVANCEKDGRVIAAIGEALKGTNKPLVITSGVGLGAKALGQMATEDVTNYDYPHPRKMSEMAGDAVAALGVNVSVMRLPQVHDTVKQGLITPLVELSRAKGVVGYLGEGQNRWAAAPVEAVARLYRIAMERAENGARYHAVQEEGVSAKEIAEALGRGLKVPVQSMTADEAAGVYGWMSGILGMDLSASSKLTRERTGWVPEGPGLLEDLHAMQY